MPGPLKTELENRLPWLFQDLGFRLLYHDYSLKSFGDSVAEIQSDTLRVLFIRDKSVISVKLSPLSEPPQWMELGFRWYTLTGDRPEPELEGWAWFLRDHLPELASALGPGLLDTQKKYERRQEEGRELVRRYLPPITVMGRLRKFKGTPVGLVLLGPLGWIISALLVGIWFVTK